MSGDRFQHHVIWHSSLLASSEHASLFEHEDERRLQGLAVLPHEGTPCHIDYELIIDREWMPRSSSVTVTMPAQVRRIDLRSDRIGHWEVNGSAAPQLDGCRDVDLGWTPATNTVPIRRLDLEIGDTATIVASWVRFPELDVIANEQQYTRLAPDRWRFRSGDYDFELVTDVVSGIVLAYGEDLWQAAATELSLHVR